jgi:hypothetical protein
MPHTPGQWSARFEKEGGYDTLSDAWLVESGTEHIAALDLCKYGATWCREPDAITAEANARLIAAAPDLLAALKALVVETERRDNPGDEGVSSDAEEMDAARSAIAKAEGSQK